VLPSAFPSALANARHHLAHDVHNEENSFAVADQVCGDLRQFKGTSKKVIFTA